MQDNRELIILPSTEYYVQDIKSVIAKARKVSCRIMNTVMVQSYWLVGKRIFLEEQKGRTEPNTENMFSRNF